mmetsp:Transcript_14765/g.43334  ORF Transcript_14765/g.43334 Transcript_14765/m.43334 type:complete len:249 (+) Transcript_14765:744-1490(+)
MATGLTADSVWLEVVRDTISDESAPSALLWRRLAIGVLGGRAAAAAAAAAGAWRGLPNGANDVMVSAARGVFAPLCVINASSSSELQPASKAAPLGASPAANASCRPASDLSSTQLSGMDSQLRSRGAAALPSDALPPGFMVPASLKKLWRSMASGAAAALALPAPAPKLALRAASRLCAGRLGVDGTSPSSCDASSTMRICLRVRPALKSTCTGSSPSSRMPSYRERSIVGTSTGHSPDRCEHRPFA